MNDTISDTVHPLEVHRSLPSNKSKPHDVGLPLRVLDSTVLIEFDDEHYDSSISKFDPEDGGLGLMTVV